jgi:hypothetical protein
MIYLLLGLFLGHPNQSPSTHTLVVTGVGGEAKYRDAFVEQAGALITNLVEGYGVDPAEIVWLAETPTMAPDRITGRSTRERVVGELQRMARTAAAADRILVVFIGHGSDAGEPKLNLPGPDLGATQLKVLLDAFPSQMVALVFAASASGGFVEQLRGPNRIVVTATKTGFERNETVFAAVFARAFGEASDIDKDGRLSLAEAFEFTTHEVARLYESDNRLQTEHARLSDSTLARRFVFTPKGRQSVPVADDSLGLALLAQKSKLERDIESLRTRRETLEPNEYDRRLEELLVALATVNRKLRERGGVPR